MRVKYLILGAGPTGLAAAYRLKELGETSFLVLERENTPGGLCQSFTAPGGFIFDIGGHIVFSKRQRYYDFMKDLGIELVKHRRNSYIWLFDRWIPYPLQNNVGHFPPSEAVKALTELAEIHFKGSIDRSNFGKFLLSSMGRTLCDHFLLPYNQKVWATSPFEMATEWMGDRVSIVDFKNVLSSALEKGIDDTWGPNNTFYYPRDGGFQYIFDRIAQRLGTNKIRYDQHIEIINSVDREIITIDGSIQYDNLISTIPLDNLCEILAPRVSYVKGTLRHNKTISVGIGYEPAREDDEIYPIDHLQPVCWLYFPQSGIPFYRVTQLSNYSPAVAPPFKKSWLAEISVDADADNKTISDQLDKVIPSLKSAKLITDNDRIISFAHRIFSYGYPVPTLGRDHTLEEIIPKLESMGIYSRGRFGSWKYEVGNTDHSVLQGFEIAERLVQQKKEEIVSSFS